MVFIDLILNFVWFWIWPGSFFRKISASGSAHIGTGPDLSGSDTGAVPTLSHFKAFESWFTLKQRAVLIPF
jgi:hypothetical protein